VSWTLKHYRGQRVQPTGMGLLGLVGLSLSLGCATAPPPARVATVTTARRPPASPVRVFIPKVMVSPEENGKPVYEKVEDYGDKYPETTAPPEQGTIEMLSHDDPLLSEFEELRIRGEAWPMVANRGASQVYPPEEGVVSFYWQAQRLASGDYFDPGKLCAAHKTLPFGTIVRCTRLDNGQYVDVIINDRGPYIKGRVLDLSKAAASRIGLIGRGIARCRIEVLAYPLIETMGPNGNG